MNARTHFVCTVPGCESAHEAHGFCRRHYSKWRRLGDPQAPDRRAPNGSGWLQKGYRVHTREHGHRFEHVEVAERALGKPLPAGACVHHVDEDRSNNAPTNLVICPSNAYHKLLHVRLNALKACGNVNWRKCPYCRQYDDTANMRGEKSGRYVHPKCSAAARVRSHRNRRSHGNSVSASSSL